MQRGLKRTVRRLSEWFGRLDRPPPVCGHCTPRHMDGVVGHTERLIRHAVCLLMRQPGARSAEAPPFSWWGLLLRPVVFRGFSLQPSHESTYMKEGTEQCSLLRHGSLRLAVLGSVLTKQRTHYARKGHDLLSPQFPGFTLQG